MAEEKREGQPDNEVKGILSDLEAVLSDLGGGSPPSAPAAPPPALKVLPDVRPDGIASAPPPKPSAPLPKPVVEAHPAPAAPVVPAATAPLPPQPPAPMPKPVVPAPPEPTPAPQDKPIELGARAITPTKTPEKKPVPPPKPAALTTFSSKPPIELGLEGGARTGAAQPPAEPPAPTAKPEPPAPTAKPEPPAPTAKPEPPAPAAKPEPPAPAAKPEPPAPAAPPAAPAPVPAPAAPVFAPQHSLPPADALPNIPTPAKVGKDQMRRVAYLYLRNFEAQRDAFAKLLDQTADTVPKKPLFLRRVLYQEITEGGEGKEVLARILQAKAVAALGIVEGLSDVKLHELSDALAGGGVMFWAVAPSDVGKRSVAIDIVVDVMLLSPEAS